METLAYNMKIPSFHVIKWVSELLIRAMILKTRNHKLLTMCVTPMVVYFHFHFQEILSNLENVIILYIEEKIMIRDNECSCICHKDDALFCNDCNDNPIHRETIIKMHKKLLDLHGKDWYEKNTTTHYAYMDLDD